MKALGCRDTVSSTQRVRSLIVRAMVGAERCVWLIDRNQCGGLRPSASGWVTSLTTRMPLPPCRALRMAAPSMPEASARASSKASPDLGSYSGCT